ncbi:hypothetical protein EDB19DRAFT_1985050 [Suillus lakei]|nr:hypothetical protein EDB19DRAFT_1985050 [Suillus lakei]
MNPPDSLGTDSSFARTNAPAASDHHVAPNQVQYFDHFRPAAAQAYSTHGNSHFLEGPGHSQLHPPHSMYRDSEYPSPRMYSLPSLHPAVPLPPGPDICGLVPPTVANTRVPSVLPLAFAEAVSDDELEQPLLAPAKGQKRLSAPTVQPSRAPPKKRTKVGGKGKGHVKPQTDPDSKSVVGEAQKKGRKAGATGYSADEVNRMLKEIGRRLPLGGKAWDAVTVTYNQWARQNHVMERSSKAIRAKYDMICRMEKPTGDGELPEYVELARQTEDAITRKSGIIALDDSEWDEGDIGSEIEVSSESDEGGRGVKAKHAGSKKTVVKAFHANPLLEPSARRPRTTAASDALSSLTSVFNPAVIKDRDETRLSSLVQFNQINTLQTELREARQRIESLNDRLMQECRRADRAESQVEMLKYMLSSCNEAHTPARSRGSRDVAHPYQASPYHVSSPSRSRRRSHYSPSHYSPRRSSPSHYSPRRSSPSHYSPRRSPSLEYSLMPGPSRVNDNTVFGAPHASDAPHRSNGLKSLALAADIAAGDKGGKDHGPVE